MILKATKIFKFGAAHKLPKHNGLCANLHGHNYELHVTFSKTFNEPNKAGEYPYMVKDFGDIKKIINPIIKKMDHKYLNNVFEDIDPTAENMAIWIAKQIRIEFNDINISLYSIKLYETDSSYIDLMGI